LGRACRTTRNEAGTYSSTSRASVPMTPNRVPPHSGQRSGGAWVTVSRGRCSGSGRRALDARSAGDGAGSAPNAAARAAAWAWFSSSSPMVSSSCSMARSIFSEERPNRARFRAASCAFSFSMCSVLAWSSASRTAISRCISNCSDRAKARRSSGSLGKVAVANDMLFV
jgi:hypothetical protein